MLAILCGCSASSLLAAENTFSLNGTTLTLTEATADVGVFFTSMRFNRAANVWNVEASLTNRSLRAWQGPLVMVVESFSGTSGLLQPDGVDANAKAFVDLSGQVADGDLASGEISGKRTLTLGFQAGAAPQLNVKIFARAPQSVAGLSLVRTLDEAGLPLPSVTVEGAVNPVQTDGDFGLATVFQTNAAGALRFSAPGFLPVWRFANATSNSVGIVPHPRLIRRGTNTTTLTPIAGGRLLQVVPSMEISFTPGAFSQDTTAHLTPLTGQTLPLFLPLGWSPLAAFWLELSTEPALPGTASVTPAGPIPAGETAALVRLNPSTPAWEVLQLINGSGSDAVTVALPGSGAFALVMPDAAPMAPPVPTVGGALLPGTTPLPDAVNLRAGGTVTPSSSPASKIPELVTGTAEVLVTNLAGNLPSGTLLRGEVSERYALRDGTRRFPALFENFVVGYQRPGDARLDTVRAEFPIRPLLLFGAEELDEAVVHVELFAPGAFSGGILDTNGGQVASEGLRVLAGVGDLVTRQAVQLQRLTVTNFTELAGSNATVVTAFEIGVNGVAAGRKLSVQLSGLGTNANFVLARVLAREGLYGLEPRERLHTDSTGNLVSDEPTSGDKLPGLNGAGQYVLLRINPTQGLVSGIAKNSAGQPAGGLPVRITSRPWLTFSANDGAFKLLAPAGDATLTVTDLISGDSGTQTVTVPNPQTPVNTQLASVSSGPRVLSVTPTNNAFNVSRVAPVVVTFNRAINPGTLGTNGIVLFGPSNQPVTASVSLNLSGTTVTLLAINPLAASTSHTLSLSTNIADFFGRQLEGSNVFAFTTESDALNRVGGQLTAYAPTNGMARVVGSAGTAEPNAPVILLNETTGATVTVLARPDGSFESAIEANPEDVLSAVFVNANGTRTTLPINRVILNDGATVLFGGGGVVTAQGELGEVALTIDPGAIPGASVIRLDALSSNQVQTLVSNVAPRGARLVGQGFALSISGDRLQSAPHVSVPVDVAQMGLQPGERPEDEVFALVAISRVAGKVGYCVVDTMQYENGRLKTSSPPFTGPSVQDLQSALAQRGLTIGALSSQLETNETLAQFADEFGQVVMNASELNDRVANELERNHPQAVPAVRTAAEFISYLAQFLPQVRSATDLFTISMAPIRIAGARKVTVTGNVKACVADAEGGCTTNSILRPVVGAVVALHQLGGSTQFLPGRIDEGFIYALSGQDGKYALVADNVALPFNENGEIKAFGLLVSATHPRFFGQRPVEGVELSPVINTYRADVFFADIDFNQPTKIPPFIAASHTPAFPGTNQTAVLTIRSTQGAARPTISPPMVVAVTPLEPGAVVNLSDVTISGLISQQTIGARTLEVKYEIQSAKPLNALLALQAATGGSGLRQVGYEIIFSGATPPDPGNIQSPDLNDIQPPTVARTVPPNNSTIGLADSIVIEFSEPIRREIVDQPTALQLDPPAGVPRLTLSADQRRLEVRWPQLEPNQPYVLTLQSTILDVRGNALDPFNPNSRLVFRTAPQVVANLTGIQNGGGVVIQGNYAFALDRGNPPALVSYDLATPGQPLQTKPLSQPFRDLTMIPAYQFVTKAGQPVQTRTLLALVGGEFAPFFDDFGNIAFAGQYLRIYDVSNPADMTLIAARRISASIGAATKIRWSPPLLAYLDSSADFQEIGLVNLQSFIIAAHLTPEEFQQISPDPFAGEDNNGDGDFVDAGETLPSPGRIPGVFAGKVGAFVLDDTTQRIQDFSFDQGNGHLSVVLGAGRRVTLGGGLAEALDPSFRSVVAAGQPIPRQNAPQANFPIPAGRPKRVFTMLNTSFTTTNGSISGDFALVSVVPEGAGTFNGLLLLDITDPLAVRELTRIEIPTGDGLAQSVQALTSGMLVLATSQHMFLLDPGNFLSPNSAGGMHPAVIAKISGAGSGSVSPATTEFGLFASNLGSKQALVQTSPLILFVSSVDTNSIIQPNGLSGNPANAQAAFNKLRVANELLPGTFLNITNNGTGVVSSTLSPPRSQVHHHVMVFAPGSAGDQIQVALESLNSSGHPLRNKGAGFPPVSAMDGTTRGKIGQSFRPGCDVTGSSLTAYRLSTNRLDSLYNVYLSKPFALTYEGMSQPQINQLRTELDRAILWSGHFLRASIDPAMENNPVLGPFASRVDEDKGTVLPSGAAIAETLPADYLMGPNPPPVNGDAEVPGTMGAISAHNGEFRMMAEDFILPSRRMPIQFRRHIGGQDLYDGPFGRGWDFEYNQRLIELSGGIFLPGMKVPLIIRGNGKDEIGNARDVIFHTGEGRTLIYSIATNNPPLEYQNDPLLQQLGWLASATAFYLPPEGIFDALLRFSDGRFVRLEPDGTQTWYSPRGRLEKIQDRYPGNVLVFDYNDRGDLARITDKSVTVDRYLDIGYFQKGGALDGSRPDQLSPNQASIGKICALRDYTMRQIDFEYDDCGHLVQKKGIAVSNGGVEGFTGREITQYGYGSSLVSANDLRSVTEGTTAGDPVFRATTVNTAGGSPVVQGGTGANGTYGVQLAHDNTAVAVASGNARTTITKPDQTQFQFEFKPDARPGKLTSSGSGAAPAPINYDYTNGLVRKITYPEGNSVTYRYENGPTVPLRSRANVADILRDKGPRPGDPIPEATFSYNQDFNFPTGLHLDHNGNQIQYRLATDGRDIGRITYPGAGDVVMTYNSFGQVLSITSVEGVETSYSYRVTDGFTDQEAEGHLQTRYTYAGSTGARGLPNTVTPPEGALFVRTYNERDELLTETRPAAGYSRLLSYDVNGNVIRTETTVDTGQTVVESRNFLQNGFLRTNLVEAVETAGGSQSLVTVFEPDAMFRVKSITYPGGLQTRTYENFDHLGRPHLMRLADYTESRDYDLNGNLRFITRGGVTDQLRYDGYDRLIQADVVADGGTEVTTRTYYGNDELKTLTVTDVGGQVNLDQRFGIDALGRNTAWTTATTDVGDATTGTAYDGPARRVTITDPFNEQTIITYNNAGQRLTQDDSTRQLQFDYDGKQNLHFVLSTENGPPFLQRFTPYNDLNQSRAFTDSLGKVSDLEPRIDGANKAVVNALNHRTQFGVSKLGEILSRTRADGMSFNFAFHPHRAKATATDVTSAGHGYDFDAAFRLKTTTYRDGTTATVNGFDLRNNKPIALTIPGGNVTLGHDAKGRLTSRTVNFAGDVRTETFTRDALDRIRTATFPAGGRTYTFDKLGPFRNSLLTVLGRQYSINADIRKDGARTSLRYPSADGISPGLELTEGRDLAGRLTSVVPSAGDPILSLMLFSSADRVGVHLLGGTNFLRCDSFYDPRKRLIARRYTVAGSSNVLAEVRYAHDAADNVVARQYIHRAGRADFFGYDTGERLARADFGARPQVSLEAARNLSGFNQPVQVPGTWSAGFHGRDYVYQPGALDFLSSAVPVNPDSLPLQPFTTNFNGFGQFLDVQNTDGFARLPDALGNARRVRLWVRPRTGTSPVPTGATLNYNGLSQLIRVARDDGVNVSFDYQEDGLCCYRRVEDASLPGGVEETVFVYHHALLIAEYDRTAGANRLKARYYYGEADVPVAADIADAGGQLRRYYLLQENTRSVMGLVDTNGIVVERYFYDAWGQPEIQTPDIQPPVIDEIVATPGGLLIRFSEPVLPQLNDPGPPAFASSLQSLQGAATITVDGNLIPGVLQYEERSPAGFGRTLHFLAGSSFAGTNAVLNLAAAQLVDEWRNANPTQSITFKINLTPGATNFVRETRTATQPAPVARSPIGNPFLFHGQYFEYDVGLVYMRARHYDPATGQFLQRDPEEYEDSVNLYAAFGHNPIINRDPTGESLRRLKDLFGSAESAVARTAGRVKALPGRLKSSAMSQRLEKLMAGARQGARGVMNGLEARASRGPFARFTRPYWERMANDGPLSEAEYFATKLRPGTSVLMGTYSPKSPMLRGMIEAHFRPMGRELHARTLGTFVGAGGESAILKRLEGTGQAGVEDLVRMGHRAEDLDVVPGELRAIRDAAVREQAILRVERPYLEKADHIYFYLTGREHPTTTRITWGELEMIFDDPKLLKKTTFIHVKDPFPGY